MIRLLLVVVSLMLGTAGALACEEYKSLSTDEMKDYRDKLAEKGADALDQLFAFQELSCSDNPTIRAYAVKTGLETATDPLLREQIMFDAMMEKSRIDIELSASPKSTARDKAFIADKSGLWTISAGSRFTDAGCINLERDSGGCEEYYVLYIRGPKVELTYSDTIGQFELTDTNELVGFVRYDDREEYTRIPAVIKLF